MAGRTLISLLLVALAACAPSVPAQADTATPVVESLRQDVAGAALPAVVAVQEVIQAVLPAAVVPQAATVSPASVALIVRWEVTSEALYTRRYQAPIWPGGASGVTWGIGYDGGHQTRLRIGQDWSAHAAVERFQATSGITGSQARGVVTSLSDVRVPFDLASDVFGVASLPQYRASARRAFGATYFDTLPADAQGALVSVVYNRGASMAGGARLEMRQIRDVCLPASDVGCIAAQIRAMCRLWIGTSLEAGLCARRRDEARLAENAR